MLIKQKHISISNGWSFPKASGAEVLYQDASVGIAGVLYDCALLLARRLVEEPQLLSGKAGWFAREEDPLG